MAEIRRHQQTLNLTETHYKTYIYPEPALDFEAFSAGRELLSILF
jgi:hypothetical protein